MGLFGKSISPEEMVKKWRQQLRSQGHQLDRQMRDISLAEEKAKMSIKMLAKKGEVAACKTLAKELVRSRKAKDRIVASKAMLNSIGMQLQQQQAMAKVAGHIQKSADIMKVVNGLMKVPEMQSVMMEMSREMTKAGVIEEMMDDTLTSMDDEDLEDEADEEVDKVLAEITKGVLGQLSPVPQGSVGQRNDASSSAARTESEDEDEELQNRLSALQS